MEMKPTYRDELRELQARIIGCQACREFIESWTEQSVPEHGLSPKWGWWFKNKFPCYTNVHYVFFRYDGKSEYMFIALRPSTGWVFDTADFFLANALKECELVREVFKVEGDTFVFYEGCFVTDLIKCRGKAKDVRKEVPEPCLGFLREELEIVRKYSGKEPKVIAVGNDARDLLWRHRYELNIRSWRRFRRKEDAPRIHLHNWAEWRGKKDVKRRKTFSEYVAEIEKELEKFGRRRK